MVEFLIVAWSARAPAPSLRVLLPPSASTATPTLLFPTGAVMDPFWTDDFVTFRLPLTSAPDPSATAVSLSPAKAAAKLLMSLEPVMESDGTGEVDVLSK